MTTTPDGTALSVIDSSESTWDASGAGVAELERGLRELGVPEESIHRDIMTVGALGRQRPGVHYRNYGEDQLREAALRARAAVYHFVGLRKTKVVATDRLPIRIPLLYLSAPALGKCRVSYKYKTSLESDHTWTVKVVGLGFAHTRTTKLEIKREFEVKTGDEKLLFWPATLIVSSVETYESRKLVGKGFRAEVAPLPPGVIRGDSIRVLQPSERSDPRISDPLRTYELEEDKPGDTESEELEFSAGTSRTFSAELGLEQLKTSLKYESAVKRERTITFGIELEGGRRYELRRLRERDGIGWL